MKILYNIAGTYRSGGMERVLANKANWLVDNGFDVVVATTDQRGRPAFFSMDDKVRCYDLNINYEENNNGALLKKILHFPKKQILHRKRLLDLLNLEKPDITISMFCNDVNFITSLKDGSKKVLEIHFAKFKRLQYGRKGLWGIADALLSKLDEFNVRKFDRFVVLTKEDETYWGNLANIVVIPNALTFVPQVQSSLEHDKVIAIGRLTYQKGFDRLIKAWAIVNRQCPEWKLEIIGEGEELEALRQLVESEGLKHKVTIVQPTRDVSQFYLDSSLLVLTSRYEGFGLVLTEAHSFGVPTVAFNCKCGPSDIILDGENGYLVEEGDIDGLADRVIALIKDEELRKQMGEAAFRNSERFSEEKVMRQWVELFEDVCRR